MKESEQTVAILQTGRIGDLWYTLPLCKHLADQGRQVEVVYDAAFGNPFTFAPYVTPRPIRVRRLFPRDKGWGHFWNEAIIQLRWLHMLRREGREVVWNQVFPFRWVQAMARGVPYVEYWYRNFPGLNFRRAETTLPVTRGDTILVFRHSQSVAFKQDAAYFDWIDRNLQLVARVTGLRPLVVAYGGQPDHPTYPTWRGSMDDYQRLIAGCGMVFGISTSGHVLGQLLGKSVVALYGRNQSVVDRIGGESVAIHESDNLSLREVSRHTRSSPD